MFLGHPILDEIRQRHALRPTKTRDGSKPILLAEGENFSKDLSRANQYVNEGAKAAIPAAKPPPVPAAPPPPPPPQLNDFKKGPPKPFKNPALLKLGGKQNVDRDELMRSIKGGVRLKKVTTVDKSAPVIQAEVELQDIVPPLQSQKFSSYASSASSDGDVSRDTETTDNNDQGFSASESMFSSSVASSQSSLPPDNLPQFNTLPRAQSHQTGRILSDDTFAVNNNTMPRVKKADECYTSPIPTREMIDAEIPTGSAANKIKLLNSLHSRPQVHSPARPLNRPTVLRSQLQSNAMAKFSAAKTEEQKPEVKSDENVAPEEPKRVIPAESKRLAPAESKRAAPAELQRLSPPEPKRLAPAETKRVSPTEPMRLSPTEPKRPLFPQRNELTKSCSMNSMNSIKKMAQKFDNSALNAQKSVPSHRFWKTTNTSSSLAAKSLSAANSARTSKESDQENNEPAIERKPVLGTLKMHNSVDERSFQGNQEPVRSFPVPTRVFKPVLGVRPVTDENPPENPPAVQQQNNGFHRTTVPHENGNAPSCSTANEADRPPKVPSFDSRRREPVSFHPAVPTTSNHSFQKMRASSQDLRTPSQTSPGSRSLTQEKPAGRLDPIAQQRSVSSENLPQYTYEPIEFKSPSRSYPKPPLFKYIVPIEIDTSDQPPPVPTSLPPRISPVVQGNVQRSIVNLNSNSREQLSGGESDGSGTKPSGHTSLSSSYSAPSSRSNNSLEVSPNFNHSLVNIVVQSESSPDSSSSISPSSNPRPFNGLAQVQRSEQPQDARILLQPTPPVYGQKQFYFRGTGIRSASPAEIEQANGGTRWNSYSTSRSTPHLDSDSETNRSNNTGFYSVPINAPWYNKEIYEDAIARMNNGYGRRSNGSRSSEEIYSNGNSIPSMGRAHKIIVGMTEPNMEDFRNMNPELLRDNFKFAIDVNSDNLLRVIPR